MYAYIPKSLRPFKYQYTHRSIRNSPDTIIRFVNNIFVDTYTLIYILYIHIDVKYFVADTYLHFVSSNVGNVITYIYSLLHIR